ncbi:hypothetical protein BKA70DRAFT_1086362, partial [Coprinopsis sp. MPI-PUGE-AT-0042]
MHRCLEIPELFRWICKYFSDHKGSLATLATTCRALRDPALDELWYDTRGLFPLLVAMLKNL